MFRPHLSRRCDGRGQGAVQRGLIDDRLAPVLRAREGDERGPQVFEPLSPLGGQEPPPLDYYIKMDAAWYELFCKHRVPFANGLGPMGPGKSVNANSAFQDMGEC